MTKSDPTLIPDGMLDRVAQRFRVLGDATRLEIVRLLVGRGELSVGGIVDALRTSQANVSKHLRLLLDAGVVQRRPEGTTHFYRVVDDSVQQVCAILCDRIEAQVQAEALSLRR
jgi:DNA-binding transcriptional ArsR family regulator